MSRPKLALFTLGGTIAMDDGAGDGAVPVLDGHGLIGNAPGLDKLADFDVTAFADIGSANIDFPLLYRLATAIEGRITKGDIDGVIITQGTDTMAESAFALSLLLKAQLPIIMTGAMRHSGHLSGDGPYNLYCATKAALSHRLSGLGVLVAMNGEIHAARWVEKTHIADVGAFKSPTSGPIALLCENRIEYLATPRPLPQLRPSNGAKVPHVPLYYSGFGDDGRAIGAVAQDASGLVVAAFGGGHLCESMAKRIEPLTKDIPVVLSSQTRGGRILESTYGYAGAEIDLLSKGMIPAGLFTPQKARILLILAISCKVEPSRLFQLFSV